MKILKLHISAILMVGLSLTTFAQHDHSNMGSSSNMNMNMNQNPYMNMTHPKIESLKGMGKM